MKIVVLSDLHINKCAKEKNPEWIEPFCNFLMQYAAEKLIVVVMGDIIESGHVEYYALADKLFSNIEKLIEKSQANFIFIPGNHDNCNGSFEPFVDFCRKHQTKQYPLCDYTEKSIFNISIDGVNLILANSNTEDHSKAGHLDLNQLSRCVDLDKVNLLMMHHSVLTKDNDSHNGIDNAENAIRFFDDNKIKFVFHGHTHVASDIKMGKNTLQFGAGSIRHSIEDVSWTTNERAQFHTIAVTDYGVECIKNWQYRSGVDRYQDYQVYPKAETAYANPFSVGIIQYDMPDEYISRYIVEKELYEGDRVSLYFHPERKTTLFSAINENKRIVLIADAGLGKSVELQYLAAKMCTEDKYFRPVLLNLRCYSGAKSIYEYIVSELPEYETIDPNTFLLIMDGFDELHNQSEFKIALENFCKKYKETRIVISMRSNFYSENFAVFEGFKTYILTELESKEINDYLLKRGISIEYFRKEAYDNGLLDMLANPFYLSRLADIFIEENELPTCTKTMRKIISGQINKDIRKFEYADYRLESKKYDSEVAHRRFAWYLQNTKVSACDENTYQTILSNTDRELLKHSSFTITSANRHSYAHNNFKEYFAALQLTLLNFADAKRYLETSDGTAIAPDWLNTLGFYIQLAADKQELEKWLLDISPLAIVKFERDRVEPELRYKCLKKQLDTIIQDNVWFNGGICSYHQLARFSQSKEAVELIISHIKTPKHIRSMNFCLEEIKCFTNLYGMDSTVYDSLVNCARNSTVAQINRATAIEAIAHLHMDNEEFTEELINSISIPYDMALRRAILKYLFVSKRTENYVDFILGGIINITYQNSSDDCIRGGERDYLINCLLSFKSTEAIEKTILWFCDKKNYSMSFYEKEKVIRYLLAQATICCNSGSTSIESVVYSLINTILRRYNYDYIDDALAFYEKTRMYFSLYSRLVTEEPKYDVIDLLKKVFEAEPELIEGFINSYLSESLPNKDTFEKYTRSLSKNSDYFEACWCALTSKTGEKYIEPEARRRFVPTNEDEQVFFNALFSKEAMQLLLQKLVEYLRSPDITLKQLQEREHEYMEFPVGCNKLYFSLVYFGNKGEYKSVRVIDFLDVINWVDYSQNKIYQIIKTKDSMPVCSQEQKTYIYQWYNELEDNVDLVAAYKRKGNNCTISWGALYFLTIRRAFGFPIKKDTALSLLAVPEFYIFEDSTQDVERKYVLIEEYAENKEIENKIKSLLRTATNTDIIDELLCGCSRYHIADGLEIAKKKCLDSGEPYSKSTAFKYIYNHFGVSVIAEEIAPYVDEDFLEFISSSLKKEDLPAIEDVLEKHMDNNKFLKWLIKIGNIKAIEKYTDLCKKYMTLPPEEHRYYETASSIAEISDPERIPQLVELTKVRFAEGFVDGDFHSIYSSLCHAFSNCAVVNFEAVYSAMQELRDNYPSETEIHAFCSRIINDICSTKQLSSKAPWDLAKIKAELSKIV